VLIHGYRPKIVVLVIIFFALVRLHLVLSIFSFPVSTAQFIGEFWTNRQSALSNVAPTVLALYRT
jgi:hypothetical protein